MKNSTRLVATLAIGAVLLVAGCGGGSDSTSSGASGASGAAGASGASGAAPDKAAFIKQADAICTSFNQAIAKAQTAAGITSKPSTAEAEKFGTASVVPALQVEIDQLNALTPPAGDEDQVGAVFSAASDGLDTLKKNPAGILNGNQFDKADMLAKDYGFKVCGS